MAKSTHSNSEIRKWLDKIGAAEKARAKWVNRGKACIAVYRGAENQDTEVPDTFARYLTPNYNSLYSNTEVIRPSLFSRAPVADVRRRFHDEHELATQAAELLQNTLNFYIDDDYKSQLDCVIDDLLLPGQGVPRIRYDAEIVRDEEGNAIDVGFERIMFEAVEWDKLIIPDVRSWQKVKWLAFGHDLDKDELEARFGKDAVEKVKWDTAEDATETTVRVWEIWDKNKRQVTHLCEKSDIVLEQVSDPLGLKEFWPIPKPVFSITSSGSLIPVPYYTQYQKLAVDLDLVTKRLSGLTDAVKFRGAYNAQFEELGEVIEGEDNALLPIKNMGTLNERGGLSAHIWVMPLSELTGAIQNLEIQRSTLKAQISDISGVAEVMRGVTNPLEAAATNRMKGQHATVRIKDMQEDIERLNRDLLRLGAEVVCNLFSPKTLQAVSGVEVTEPLFKFLQSDDLRNFNVDIETNSTIAIDEAAEQEATTNMLSGMVQLVQGFGPAVEAGQISPDVVIALAKVALRPFRGAREIDEILNSASAPDAKEAAQQQQMQQAQQMIEGLQQQIVALLQDREIDKARLQIEQQRVAQQGEKIAADIENQDARLALDAQVAEEDADVEKAKLRQQAQSDGMKVAADLGKTVISLEGRNRG